MASVFKQSANWKAYKGPTMPDIFASDHLAERGAVHTFIAASDKTKITGNQLKLFE